jgi:DNA polymerase-4
MRAKDRAGRTITVRVRFVGMRSVTRSTTLGFPVAATLTLTEIAEGLAWQGISGAGESAVEITLLGISVSNLVSHGALQLELPIEPEDPQRPGSSPGAARWVLDRSMDAVREKFGKHAVGYLPAELTRRGGVPDDFRELAERDL